MLACQKGVRLNPHELSLRTCTECSFCNFYRAPWAHETTPVIKQVDYERVLSLVKVWIPGTLLSSMWHVWCSLLLNFISLYCWCRMMLLFGHFVSPISVNWKPLVLTYCGPTVTWTTLRSECKKEKAVHYIIAVCNEHSCGHYSSTVLPRKSTFFMVLYFCMTCMKNNLI